MTTPSYGPPSSSSRASPWRTTAARPADRARRANVRDPRGRVGEVAGQELAGALDRPARAPVLVAPVLALLRRAREVEVEVRREPRRARGAGEHDAQDVVARVLGDQRAEVEQLGGGLRREPLADEAGRLLVRDAEPPGHVADVGRERLEIVLARLDGDQERVERGDVDAHGVVARLERLHQRRARAGERVEHAAAGPHVALQQRLDELGHELAQVGMQPVDVLRPLALGQLSLRPGEREVELAVQGLLRRRHGDDFHARSETPRPTRARGRRRPRAPRGARARRRCCRAAGEAARPGRARPRDPAVRRRAAPAARAREPA